MWTSPPSSRVAPMPTLPGGQCCDAGWRKWLSPGPARSIIWRCHGTRRRLRIADAAGGLHAWRRMSRRWRLPSNPAVGSPPTNSSTRMASTPSNDTPTGSSGRSASSSAATTRPSISSGAPERAWMANACSSNPAWPATCARRHRPSSECTDAIPATPSPSVATTLCSRRPTDHRSSPTSTVDAATRPSRTSRTSSSSPTPRRGSTTPAERSASPSTSRSTSGTSTWSTPTSAGRRSRSWGR